MQTKAIRFGKTGVLRAFAALVAAANAVLIRRQLSADEAAAVFASFAASTLICTAIIGGTTSWALAHLGRVGQSDRRSFLLLLYQRLGLLIVPCLAVGVAISVLAAPDPAQRMRWGVIGIAVTLLRCADMASSESHRACGQVDTSNLLAVLGPLLLLVDVQLAVLLGGTGRFGPMLLVFAGVSAGGLVTFGWLANDSRHPQAGDVHDHGMNRAERHDRTRLYFATATITALAGGLDLVLAPRILGVDEAANYAVGVRAALVVSFPVLALGVTAAGRVAAAQREPSALAAALGGSALATRRALVGAGGLYVAGLATWAMFGPLVIGQTSSRSLAVFALLGMAHLVNVAFGPTVAFLNAIGRPGRALTSMAAGLIALLLGIGLCALLGASTGVALSCASFAQLVAQNAAGNRLLVGATGQGTAAWAFRRTTSAAAAGDVELRPRVPFGDSGDTRHPSEGPAARQEKA